MSGETIALKQLARRFLPLRWRNAARLALKQHPFDRRLRWPDLAMVNLSRGDVVFDIGANVGNFTECVLAYQPWAVVHAFEPLPQPFTILSERFREYTDIHCRNLAMGSRREQKSINVNRFAEASSFLENGRLLNNSVYGIDFAVESSLPVSIETLADYAGAHAVSRIKLLKLDVQGYELEVLKGAEPVLEAIEFIYTEAQFQELYKHGPLFTDIFDFLSRRRFELLRMTSFRADDDGRLMECDMVFRNRRA